MRLVCFHKSLQVTTFAEYVLERESERGAAGTRSQISCVRVIKKEKLRFGQVSKLNLKAMPHF